LYPISPVDGLTYGVIEPEGGVDVRLTYDHRVLDGATVARALVRMEQLRDTTIRNELGQARRSAAQGCGELYLGSRATRNSARAAALTPVRPLLCGAIQISGGRLLSARPSGGRGKPCPDSGAALVRGPHLPL
jgi:hypothetical protein